MAKGYSDKIKALEKEFGLYEYIWPIACGEDRSKWEAAAAMVDTAAKSLWRNEDSGTMADGRTRCTPTPFVGDNAERYKRRVRHMCVHILGAGVPKFLTETAVS